MSYNKIIYKGETLIDLTQDTVTPETLAEGVTAHAKNGEVIVGTNSGGGSADFDAFIEGREFVITGNAVKVGEGIFSKNSKVVEVDLPKASYIGTQSFMDCDNLKTVSIPKVIVLADEAFCGCENLTSVYAPELDTIGVGSFAYSGLSSVNLPSVTYIDVEAFRNSNLSSFDAYKKIRIADGAFSFCSNFKALILRYEEIGVLNIGSILGTKIVSFDGTPTGEGFIYVPTSLYESYIEYLTEVIIIFANNNEVPMDEPTATYIATAILRKLEDYTVDGTTTGELDESKI